MRGQSDEVCAVTGGDIRGLNAAAARSCDRPHRLKRCGVTMVTRIATSAWRAQSRVKAALACDAKGRARARACAGDARAGRLQPVTLLFPASEFASASKRVSSQVPAQI